MFTKSDSTPTPSDYHTGFEFPNGSSFSQASKTSVLDLHVDVNPELIPQWSNSNTKSNGSNKSYSAVSADDVDRLRSIIRNMKHKRNDGINIQTDNSRNDIFIAVHTPNLSYNKYQFDGIYKYYGYNELKSAITHSTNNHNLYEPRWNPTQSNINRVNINDNQGNKGWSYYREIAMKRKTNSMLTQKPDGNYFILAQLSHNVMNNALKTSFISNLNELEEDEAIKYDLRDVVKNQHLHHKTHEFGKQDLMHKYMVNTGGMTPPRYYAPIDPDDSDSDAGITPRFCVPDLYDLKSNESNISSLFNYNIPSPMNQSLCALRSKSVLSLRSDTVSGNDFPLSPLSPTITNINNNNGIKYIPQYNSDIKCIKYECVDDDGNRLPIINRNTAFIHDIIDPNKNINDHRLWIPSLFDCTLSSTKGFNALISSQIVGLDYVKYSGLYENIGDIFKNMQFMFENVLNRKLGVNERVIMRCTKRVLQKYGDETRDSLCSDGMGENIQCIGLYLVEIHNRKYINIKLQNKSVSTELNLSDGDCIVFSNDCYHCIQRIVHNNPKCDEAIYYTLLSFYLIEKNQANVNYNSNHNALGVNLVYNWSYIIAFWLRLHVLHDSYAWMNGFIYLYLFGIDYDEYIYDRRQTMRSEKQKVENKHDDSFNIAHHLQSLLNEININQ